jgi:hypothetical protein
MFLEAHEELALHRILEALTVPSSLPHALTSRGQACSSLPRAYQAALDCLHVFGRLNLILRDWQLSVSQIFVEYLCL